MPEETLSRQEQENLEQTKRIRDRLAESGLYPELEPEPLPRYRYFQKRNGPMFCWTTERVNTDDDKLRFVSFVYKPVGPGSRSGKAQEWKPDTKLWVSHVKRKDAKARALRLYKKDQAKLDG